MSDGEAGAPAGQPPPAASAAGGDADAGDLHLMQHAVVQPDGAGALLSWLARRAGGAAAVFAPDGALAKSSPPAFPPDVLKAAGPDIRRVASGQASSAAVSGPDWWAHVTGADGGRGGPAVMVTSRSPLPPGDRTAVVRAAGLVAVRWLADDRERAVTEIRRAVLSLLMAGQAEPARQLAARTGPALAPVIRVAVVDGPPGDRDAAAAEIDRALGGRAWIVHCPVYRRHLIVLVPDDGGPAGGARAAGLLRGACPGLAIGVGGAVPLASADDGWTQACHALAAARHRPDLTAEYLAAGDLASVLGPGARRWAGTLLEPLDRYEPRGQDPGGRELADTLRAWLDFRGGATRFLQVHRNTLRPRLDRVSELLRADVLASVEVQAQLHLALQLRHLPVPGWDGPSPGLEEVLAQDSAASWARMLLAPLAGGGGRVLDTVRAWLEHETRADPAAAELGISARALHRRLARAEACLGRSLAGWPSARYDVWLALRAARLAGDPRGDPLAVQG